MACNCGNKGKAVFKVVTAEGKVVYQSTRQGAAETVQKRYPGSTIQSG